MYVFKSSSVIHSGPGLVSVARIKHISVRSVPFEECTRTGDVLHFLVLENFANVFDGFYSNLKVWSSERVVLDVDVDSYTVLPTKFLLEVMRVDDRRCERVRRFEMLNMTLMANEKDNPHSWGLTMVPRKNVFMSTMLRVKYALPVSP